MRGEGGGGSEGLYSDTPESNGADHQIDTSPCKA